MTICDHRDAEGLPVGSKGATRKRPVEFIRTGEPWRSVAQHFPPPPTLRKPSRTSRCPKLGSNQALESPQDRCQAAEAARREGRVRPALSRQRCPPFLAGEGATARYSGRIRGSGIARLPRRGGSPRPPSLPTVSHAPPTFVSPRLLLRPGSWTRISSSQPRELPAPCPTPSATDGSGSLSTRKLRTPSTAVSSRRDVGEVGTRTTGIFSPSPLLPFTTPSAHSTLPHLPRCSFSTPPAFAPSTSHVDAVMTAD